MVFASKPSASSDPPSSGRTKVRFGLSGKLLFLTIVFVMLSEVLIYVPSIANFRNTWVNDRLRQAMIAATALNVPQTADNLNPMMQDSLLQALGATELAIIESNDRYVLADEGDITPQAAYTIDMMRSNALNSIAGAFRTLLNGSDQTIRLKGEEPSGRVIEVLVREMDLRQAMLDYSRNILILSLIISLLTASCVYLTLNVLFVRPLQRLDDSMDQFALSPERRDKMIVPSRRKDEIGRAEERLKEMQEHIAATLNERKRLADLGLAVSKINHDLRNLLASAQVFSDYLTNVKDPTVQRLAPKIVHSIDRAVSFCESTLAYGHIQETAPRRDHLDLPAILQESLDFAGLTGHAFIAVEQDLATHVTLQADRDHLFRILLNLFRNARQAMEQAPRQAEPYRLSIRSEQDNGSLILHIQDNGPGIPEPIRAKLFKPFQAGLSQGSCGLGLSIVKELVELNQGTVELKDTEQGTHFVMCFPLPPDIIFEFP
jgi:signal transduction histidine kinase